MGVAHLNIVSASEEQAVPWIVILKELSSALKQMLVILNVNQRKDAVIVY